MIGLGVVMYRLRSHKRALYGAIELAVACLACWLSVEQLHQGGMLPWMGAAGAVYVVVRGLDNLLEGLKTPAPAHPDTAPKPAT